jgi:hypothetical protein
MSAPPSSPAEYLASLPGARRADAGSQPGKVFAGMVCIRFKKLADLNLSGATALVREASALLDNGRTDFSL